MTKGSIYVIQNVCLELSIVGWFCLNKATTCCSDVVDNLSLRKFETSNEYFGKVSKSYVAWTKNEFFFFKLRESFLTMKIRLNFQ